MNNPCIRCGKQRTVSKTWKEKIVNPYGVSEVVYSESVCSDPACQKIVMQERAVVMAKSELIKKNKEDRKNSRG